VLVLAAVIGLSAVIALLLAPAWVALSALLVTIVLFEANPQGFLSTTSHFYSAGGKIGLPFMFFLLVVAALLFDLVRTGEPFRIPGPLTYPLLFLLGAALIGIINGKLSGAGRGAMISQIETLLMLGITPFVVVNALRTRTAVRNFALIGAGLAVFKGFEGTVGWAMGQGMSFGSTTLTYIEPTANWLMLLLLLTIAVAVIHRVPTSAWVRWGSLFAFAALVLSFRRSFWIGAILGFILILLFATGRRGGRVLLPGIIIFLIAFGAAYVVAGPTNSSNPLQARAKALSPSQIQLNADDRYRIEERRNVLKDLAQRPIYGLGIGVPWVAHRAVSLDFNGARQYVHFLPLWYWMKMGIFGLIAYVWLFGTALYMGFSLWRRHPDGLHRAIGLAAFAGFAGLMVVETTASFTGVDTRFSIVVGAALGWLAAARATMNDAEPEKNIEAGLTQPILAGRRAMATGVEFARSHKAWRAPAVASVLVLAGAVALVAAVIGIAGG
jgi:O-antigen ligase/polysaccharide polymerase Wzy-like membrane protein